MKICFFGDGNSVHIKRWLDFFISRGHEVHLVTFADVIIENVEVHKVGDLNIKTGGGNWKYLLYVNRIRKIIKSIKPDVISGHYITSYGTLAALSGFRPVALTAWGTDILVTSKKNYIYKMITKFALNKASLITSESMFVTNEVEKLSSTKVLTVPMGVSKHLCSLQRKEDAEEINILSLRALTDNSNIDIIIDAFNLLVKSEKDKKFRLVITNDGPNMTYIKEKVNQIGISNMVDIKGFVTREELIDLYLTSNLHISIPTSDSTSVTLLEAMACGTMNIVSDIPSNGEWIENGVNGVVLYDMKPENLAQCMKRTLEDKELRERSIDINKKIIINRAIWDDNMRLVESEFLKLI